MKTTKRKFSHFLKKNLNYLKKTSLFFQRIPIFLKKHNLILQIFLNISMLLISIFAIVIAVKSYKNANKQFIENSIKSDSLFKIQLANEQKINLNLEKIQELTNHQIEIINQQLGISSKILDDQINSNRPIVVSVEDSISDQFKIFNDQYAPIIHSFCVNNGKRYAYDLKYRAFLITRDYNLISTNEHYKPEHIDIGPEVEYEWSYKPKLELDSYKFNTCFYYCYMISYIDRLTHKTYNYTSYLEYVKERGKFHFNTCKEETLEKLRNVVNKELRMENLPIIE